MSPEVVIIDSGICNLFNIRRAFENLGAKVVISCDRKQILGAPRVILPGVGAFGSGMKNLERLELVSSLWDYVASGKLLFGICLGMQMLLSHSEEHGIWDGLGIIPGRVRRFREANDNTPSYKIPQIGWNTLEPTEKGWSGSLLDGITQPISVYFVHSYVVEPASRGVVLARTFYGQDDFCSVLANDNILACQFHHERSGPVGLKILQNFLNLGN